MPAAILSMHKLLAHIKPILPYLRNRYIIAIVGFTAWMFFFDQYNVRSQVHVNGKLKELRKEQSWYAAEIEKLEDERERLQQNPMEIERVARERYYMKRDNEDVFVIVETPFSK